MLDELTWRERGRLWLRLGLRLGVAIASVWLLLRVGLPLLNLLMPFVAALILAWMLNPAIRFLQKKLGWKRNVLSLVLVLVCIFVLGVLAAGLVYSLVSQVISFLQNWQPLWADTMYALDSITGALEEFLKPLPGETYAQLSALLERAVGWLGDVVPQLLTRAAGSVGNVAMSLPAWTIGFVIFLMASYFISADYPHLRFKLTRSIPKEFRGFFSDVKRVAVDAFGGYVKAELILSGVIFVILLVGFLVMGEPYALLLAFILGVMDFIPIIGSGTAMVPWAVIDVALGNYQHAVGLMVVWGIIAVFRRVAEPKVVGDQTGLSPIASLVSIYVGMRLGGVLGMIMGPVVSLVALSILRGGVLDSTFADLRLAMTDIIAILKGGKGKGGNNSKNV